MNAETRPIDRTAEAEGLRRGRRANAFLLAFVEAGGAAIPVRLRNISSTGALIEAEAGFALGATVLFRRAFAALPAQVVWARGGRFGLLFGRPIAEEDVIALSRRILAPAG